MGTIITLDKPFSAPIAGNPVIGVLGEILTSDGFARTGPLLTSSTDAYRGGAISLWEGVRGSPDTSQTATANGVLNVNQVAVSSICTNVGTPDVNMSIIVKGVGATTAGLNTMIDFRKALADTGDCYRVAIFLGTTTNFQMRLYKRVANVGTQISPTPDIAVLLGQTLKIVAKGSSIKVYVDDVIKWDVTDTSITAGNFCGFSTSSNNRGAAFSDLIIREAV